MQIGSDAFLQLSTNRIGILVVILSAFVGLQQRCCQSDEFGNLIHRQLSCSLDNFLDQVRGRVIRVENRQWIGKLQRSLIEVQQRSSRVR